MSTTPLHEALLQANVSDDLAKRAVEGLNNEFVAGTDLSSGGDMYAS